MGYDSTSASFRLDTPPFTSGNPELMLYVEEQRRRRSMMYGGWPDLARARVERRLGVDRTDAMGDPDLLSNAFSAVMSALAVLYSAAPKITNSIDPSAVDLMTALVNRAGLWPRQQRVQRDCLAMREILLNVDGKRIATTKDPANDLRIIYRPVPVDLTEMVPDPQEPERPIEVCEYRRRPLGGVQKWTKEYWSLARGGAQHWVSDGVVDVSAEYSLPKGGLGFSSEHPYPTLYVDGTGRPRLPYVLYHAALTGNLLDSFYGIELVEGTLELACDWTYFHHVLRNAAFAKIYGIGCRPVTHVDVNGRKVVISDPTAYHEFELSETFQGQPTVGVLAQTVSAVDVGEAVGIYERKIGVFGGIDPSDFQKMGGDAKSGYAIALSTEGKRAAALRYAPVFQFADAETLALTAIVANRLFGSQILPEDGWSVVYAGLGDSLDAAAPKEAGAKVDVQTTALNGAQSDAMGAVLDAVATGNREKAVAIAQLQFVFKMSLEEAKALVDPILVKQPAPVPAAFLPHIEDPAPPEK